jgi:hypothetical protein
VLYFQPSLRQTQPVSIRQTRLQTPAAAQRPSHGRLQRAPCPRRPRRSLRGTPGRWGWRQPRRTRYHSTTFGRRPSCPLLRLVRLLSQHVRTDGCLGGQPPADLFPLRSRVPVVRWALLSDGVRRGRRRLPPGRRRSTAGCSTGRPDAVRPVGVSIGASAVAVCLLRERLCIRAAPLPAPRAPAERRRAAAVRHDGWPGSPSDQPGGGGGSPPRVKAAVRPDSGRGDAGWSDARFSIRLNGRHCRLAVLPQRRCQRVKHAQFWYPFIYLFIY